MSMKDVHEALAEAVELLAGQMDDDKLARLDFLVSALEPFEGHKEQGTVPVLCACPNCKHEWPIFYTPMSMHMIGRTALGYCPKCMCSKDLMMRWQT